MNEDNQNSLQSIKDNTETDTTNTDTDVLPSYENLKEDTNKNDSPQEPSEESENSINDENEFPQNPEEVEKDDKENFNQNEDFSNYNFSNKAPSQELNDNDDDNTGKGNYTPNIILPGFVGNWTEEEKKKLTEKGRLRSKLKSRQKKRKLFIHRNNIIRRD